MNGIYALTAEEYHQDTVAAVPSLSASICKLLIDSSPPHAKAAHPRLTPELVREPEDRFDVGTCAHALFLEGESGVHVVYADSWRTQTAKDERDLARQHGRIPLLEKNYAECEQMVKALRAQCDTHSEGPFFTDGEAEKTLAWEDEYGVQCRARLDWLLNDRTAIHDLKSTRASASPESWSRTMYGFGAPLQMAFYIRGARAVFDHEPEFRFIVIEVAPPYAMSVVSLAPDALALADKQIAWAIKEWARCLRNDAWPGYEQKVAYAEAPPWLEAQWLAKELREAVA